MVFETFAPLLILPDMKQKAVVIPMTDKPGVDYR